MPNNLRTRQALRRLSVLLLAISGGAVAQPLQDQHRLLEESEYRSELEEVVVVGKQPEWRVKSGQDQEWRPPKFELSGQENRGRMEWFPEYTEDERDRWLEQVRDGKDEKPGIKIFEWKF